MAPYIYLNLFVLIFSSKELFAPNYLNKILSVILCIILILFVGLRYKVGGDWVPYEIIYFDSQSYKFKDLLFKGQDYLFYLINYFIALTGFENGNVFLNLLISTFVFFSFYKYINFNKLNLISFIIFYPFIVIILMGFIRQSIALGFLFLILSNKLEKNIIKNIFY